MEDLIDGIERFLSGRLEKAAGIDDNVIGIGKFRCHRVARLKEQADHDLGVDEIARTAKADEEYSVPGELKVRCVRSVFLNSTWRCLA